jgi:hypothetical protein
VLEPIVAEHYSRKTGNKVRRINALLQHPASRPVPFFIYCPNRRHTMIKGLAITPPIIGRISIGRVIEKNGKPLESLRPIEIDKKQSVWTLNFLRRENKKLPLLSTDNGTIRSQYLGYWINQLQRHCSISKQDNASTADRLMANAIEAIDTRMRNAWDSQVS